MFTKEIMDLALVSETANTLFPNIVFTGGYYNNDRSLMATIRALLYERIKPEEKLTVFKSIRDARWNQVDDMSTGIFCEWVVGDIEDYGCWNDAFQIVGINSDMNQRTVGVNQKYFELIDSGFIKKFGKYGFESAEDIVRYFQQSKVTARLFISQERHVSILFVDNLDIKKWHYIQHIMPRYMPWFFNNNPITAEEKKFLASLANRYSPDYENCLREFATKLDFRTAIVRSQLSGFENTFIRSQLDSVRSDINSYENELRNLEERLSTYMRTLTSSRFTEAGILAKLAGLSDDGEDELLDYFLANKSLELISASNGTIKFTVNTVVANWNPDMAERYINSDKSCFFRSYYRDIPYMRTDVLTFERMQKLLKEIFVKERFRLRMVAKYSLNFRDFRYKALGRDSINYTGEDLATHVYNPHIWRFECLGNNGTIIQKAVRARDFIAAIEACTASARSINLEEPNTMSYMMNLIYDESCGKVIEMPDGTLKTPLEAIEWLEAEENESQQAAHNTEPESIQATTEIEREGAGNE